MKKLDNISGVTLEVPGTAPPLGQFPFPGFWAEVKNQLAGSIEQRGRTGGNRYEISQAIGEISNLTNGAFKITVEEKLWRIGELMRLNPFVSAHGDGGATLGYIATSADNGRVEIAAASFEPLVAAVLQRTANISSTHGDLQALTQQYNAKMEETRNLMQGIANLEGSRLAQDSLDAAYVEHQAAVRNIQVLEHEIRQLSFTIGVTEQLVQEISQIDAEIRTMQTEHQAVLNQITRVRELSNQAMAKGNQQDKAKYDARLFELNQKNAALKQRIQNLGTQLQRMMTTPTNLDQQKETLEGKRAELRTAKARATELQATLNSMIQTAQANETDLTQLTTRASALNAELTALGRQIENAQIAYAAATQGSETEMMRVWVPHLSGVYRDTEAYMFENLRRAAATATSPAGSIGEYTLSAEIVAQMEAFQTAVDTIAEKLDKDEVDVLNQIARLGAVQSYIPGPARVIALADMTYRGRVVAYRTMIDEIMSNGTDPELQERMIQFKIGPIKIGTSEPLREVEELLRHITNAKLGE